MVSSAPGVNGHRNAERSFRALRSLSASCPATESRCWVARILTVTGRLAIALAVGRPAAALLDLIRPAPQFAQFPLDRPFLVGKDQQHHDVGDWDQNDEYP